MRSTTLAALAACALATGCSRGEQNQLPTVPTDAKELRTTPDRGVVTLTGTVVEARPGSFLLDYGQGTVTVEMDDFDAFAEGALLVENDEVVVYGRVDDDFFEQKTVEAGSVYVEGLGTQFFANTADEEEYVRVTAVQYTSPYVDLVGAVTSVGEEQFVLDTGAAKLTVGTGILPYDPLDDEGFQQLEEGDLVRVSGKLESALFEEKDLTASQVVSLGAPERGLESMTAAPDEDQTSAGGAQPSKVAAE